MKHTEQCRTFQVALEILAREFQRDFVSGRIIALISEDCPPCQDCSCYIETQLHSGKVYLFELQYLRKLIDSALGQPPAQVLDMFPSDTTYSQ